MTLTFDYRARLLLLVFLLVLAGAVLGVMTYTRHHDSGSSSAPSQPATPRPATHPAVAKSAAAHPVEKTAVKPKHHAKTAAAKPRHPAATAAAAADRLPLAVRHALAANKIVVVALYDPRAKIDGTALAEARAGARLAGSSFVAVDVRTRAVDSLNAQYGAVHDPSVLVLRPPKQLVVRIDGFADRDTVAQAAVNAAS